LALGADDGLFMSGLKPPTYGKYGGCAKVHVGAKAADLRGTWWFGEGSCRG